MEKFNPQICADCELERITIRINHKTKEDLATIAQNENISLNSLIIRCIEFSVKYRTKMEGSYDMKLEGNDLIREEGEKLKQLIENQASEDEIYNQSKLIDEYIIAQYNKNMGRQQESEKN